MSPFQMRVPVVLSGLLLLAPLACTQAQAQQTAPAPAPAAPQGTAPQGAQAAKPGGTNGLQQPATRESQSLPTVAPLVDSVKSAVVNVDVQSRITGRGGMGEDDPFDRFFNSPFGGQQNPRRPRREPLRQGMGSGTIIDASGLVLTNNHVVEGAVVIRVKLDDGRQFEAEIVGRDPLTDVALIRLKGKPENLPFVKLGDSDAVRPGDWVVAIGNPFGLTSSVSIGIISAKARNIHAGPYDDFIQTDAAINPGNSGGPLFSMQGEVIGINTAIVGGGTGIGFAVPSNLAKALIPHLQKDGVVTRGWLGIGIQTLSPDLAKALGSGVNEGAVVVSINQGSPAKKAGLQRDDVIVALDGAKVTSSEQLTRTVALKRPGSTTTLSVLRGGKKQDLKVVLGTRPSLDGEREAPSTPEDEGRKLRIGMSFTEVDPRLAQVMGVQEGAMITDVVPGTPADRAELSRGMVIVEADRKPVRSPQDLEKILRNAKSGATLLLRIQVPGEEGGGTVLRALSVP
ncbi:MAG TPA: Do family serine endopeptidase [Myxococcaceae bacterium]|nr:Do family serine endopeptidase [Myxococcaceae bacterium]